jgi:hypothetical protein
VFSQAPSVSIVSIVNLLLHKDKGRKYVSGSTRMTVACTKVVVPDPRDIHQPLQKLRFHVSICWGLKKSLQISSF